MRQLLTPILATAMLLSATGCEMLTSGGKAKAVRTQTLTMPIPASGSLSVQNRNGEIKCVAAEVDAISVEAKITVYGPTVEDAEANLELVEIMADENGRSGDLTVTYPPGVSGTTSLTITLPRELALKLSSSNGAIDVTGVVGGVNAKSSNGAIRIVEASGDITVDSSNGGVAVGGQDLSNLSIKTSNGAIGLSGSLVPGDHNVSTNNGAVEVVIVGGVTDVTAKTGNGKIVNDRTRVKSGQTVRLGEASGDDSAVSRMKVQTSNGAVRFSLVQPETATDDISVDGTTES